jgi:hypothetical protein
MTNVVHHKCIQNWLGKLNYKDRTLHYKLTLIWVLKKENLNWVHLTSYMVQVRTLRDCGNSLAGFMKVGNFHSYGNVSFSNTGCAPNA